MLIQNTIASTTCSPLSNIGLLNNEGVNLIKRHTRPTQDNPQGGIVEREGSIHISNVMLIHSGKPTRIGYKKLDDGSKVRIAIKTGDEIS